MTRVSIRRHLIQIKFARPDPRDRIYIPAEPPVKIISIILGVFAVLTCPLWIGAAFWGSVVGTFWLIQNAPWMAGLAATALILSVAHGVAWEHSAYRYWFWGRERRAKDLLEKLGWRKSKVPQ